MKYLRVFALVIFAACNLQAELTKEGILQIEYRCMKKLALKLEDLRKELLNDDVTNRYVQCYIQCTFGKAGVMNAQSRLNKAVAKQYLGIYTTADVTALIDTCSAITVNQDGCKAGPQYRKCFINELRRLG